MFTATLIAAGRLTPNIAAAAQERLAATGCAPTTLHWIDADDAADLHFGLDPVAARRALEGAFAGVDIVVQPRDGRRKMLLVADMDSTMITVECIDELADYAGLKPQIAAITEAAMRGELDFEAALDARVALLKGLDAGVIDACLRERVRLMPGARALVRTMRGWGATAVLVSGGFKRFAEPVACILGREAVRDDRCYWTVGVGEAGRLRFGLASGEGRGDDEKRDRGERERCQGRLTSSGFNRHPRQPPSRQSPAATKRRP